MNAENLISNIWLLQKWSKHSHQLFFLIIYQWIYSILTSDGDNLWVLGFLETSCDVCWFMFLVGVTYLAWHGFGMFWILFRVKWVDELFTAAQCKAGSSLWTSHGMGTFMPRVLWKGGPVNIIQCCSSRSQTSKYSIPRSLWLQI